MNIAKLAQLVKDLENSGLENEATELADAIIEETDPNQILNRPDIINSIDSLRDRKSTAGRPRESTSRLSMLSTTSTQGSFTPKRF